MPGAIHKTVRCLLLLLVFLCCKQHLSAQKSRRQQYLEIQGKVFKDRLALQEAEFSVVTMNGYPINSSGSAKNGLFTLQLPLDNEYLITIRYPFCYDKTIYISTYITDKGSRLNWFFEFNIDMIEWYPKIDSLKSLHQPVARLQYYGNQFGFDYDEEYTGKAQRALAREVQEANQETSREEQKAYIAQLKKAEFKREALEQKELTKKEDEARLAAERVEQQQKTDESNRLEEARQKRKAELQALFEAGKAKRRADSLAKAEALQRQQLAAKEERKASQAPAVISDKEEDRPAPDDMEEILKYPNRIIVKNTVYRDNKAFVYKKVTYNFGGVYYFRDGVSIGKDVYELELKSN